MLLCLWIHCVALVSARTRSNPNEPALKQPNRREDESHHACAEVDSQLGLVAQLPAKTFGHGHVNLPPSSTAVWWTSGRQQTQSTNRPPARTRDPDGRVPPSPRPRAVATSLRAHVCFEPAPSSKPHCCQVGRQQTTKHAKCAFFLSAATPRKNVESPRTASLPKTAAENPGDAVAPRGVDGAATASSGTGRNGYPEPEPARAREPDKPVIPSPRRPTPPAAAPVRSSLKNPPTGGGGTWQESSNSTSPWSILSLWFP